MNRNGRSPVFFHYLRLPDFIILFLTVAITVFCTVKIYGKNGSTLQFVIQGKDGSWVYPVNQTVTMDIPGPLGKTTVVLKDGKAHVVSSPCANQTCVGSPSIQKKGQWIACLPNAVFVRIELQGETQSKHADLDGAVW